MKTLLLVLGILFHSTFAVRIVIQMQDLVYFGLTPQTSDVNGLTSGQTLIKSAETELPFGFENAQIKIKNVSFPYSDLKYGYSIASLSDANRTVAGSLINPVLQIPDIVASQGAIFDITPNYVYAYFTDMQGFNKVDLATGEISQITFNPEVDECANCSLGGILVNGIDNMGREFIISSCSADQAYDFGVFEEANGNMIFPLACVITLSQNESSPVSQISDLLLFEGSFALSYFDYKNWSPITTYNKIYTNALGVGTVSYNNTNYNIFVSTLAIAQKDGTRNTFIYFFETSATFQAIYYPLNSIFGTAVISSVDIFFYEEGDIFFVALGVPDADTLVIIACEFPSFMCNYDYFLKASETSIQSIVVGSKFGSKVAFDPDVPKLFVSASGDFENILGNVHLFEYQNGHWIYNTNFLIPSLIHPVQYPYDFQVVLNEGFLVLSYQDDIGNWGFNEYQPCQEGHQYNPNLFTCSPCPMGQFQNNTQTYTHCKMCPDFTFVDEIGSISLLNCSRCPQGYLCPPGSRLLLQSEVFENLTFSLTKPDWVEIAESREDVEFESTFYLSCIYYIILFIALNMIWVGVLFIPWPCLRSLKHQNPKSVTQLEKFRKLVLKVNFFAEEEEKEEKKEEKDKHSRKEHSKEKEEEEEEERDILGSLVSFIYISVVGVLFAFCFVFWHHNETLEATTQSLKSLSSLNSTLVSMLDTSPFTITVTLFGSDEATCNNFELEISGNLHLIFISKGCKFNGLPCNTTISPLFCNSTIPGCEVIGQYGIPLSVDEIGASFCSISAIIPQGAILEGNSVFTFGLSDETIPFYTQLLLYQVVGRLDEGNVSNWMSDFITIPKGSVLRGQQNIEISTSMVIFKSCESEYEKTSWTSLYKATYQECSLEESTFVNNSVKLFAPFSSVTNFVESDNFYNNLENTFSISFTLIKSQFFVAVNEKPIISVGELITVLIVVLLGVLEWNEFSVEIIRKIKKYGGIIWKKCQKKKHKKKFVMDSNSSAKELYENEARPLLDDD